MGTLSQKIESLTSGILEVRYTDLEQEKALCRQLLALAEEEGHAYGKVFAMTYLGDYYLTVCQSSKAGEYLLSAEGLLEEGAQWDFLRQQVSIFLGIYYDMCSDEQNAVDNYWKAITIAERRKDTRSESIALNNLAFVFYRHRCYDEALNFYQKAYQKQTSPEDLPLCVTLLANLADALLRLGRYEEAKGYLEDCTEAEKGQELQIMSGRGWCSYYIAMKDQEKAFQYADYLLSHQESISQDKLTAFEYYHVLCAGMIDLGDGGYAKRFLEAMEEVSDVGAVDRVKCLEELKIRYALLFDPEETHGEAYHRFYVKSQQFRAKISQTIIDAMKSQIYLNQLVEQTRDMKSEQENLSHEVVVDELTGIYNRRHLDNLMRQYGGEADSAALGVIILDVDYFKEYNDFYGHRMGDMVLCEIADCLKPDGPGEIVPCRYGGDEFVCLCRGLSAEQMEAYIQSVRARLHTKAIAHEKSLCDSLVTLSIGYMAAKENETMEGHLLFQLADQALYQSKRSGRNTYTGNKMCAV